MSDSTSTDFDGKRGAIIRAAAELFSRYGFKKTTLGDIAERSGLAKPSLYHYFQSKEELISAVVSQESHALLDLMRSAVERADGAGGKIEAFIRARYEYVQKMRNLYAVTQEVFREVHTLVMTERDKFFEAELRLLTEIMEEGVATGELDIADPELFARVAISALQGIDMTFMRYGSSDDIAEGLRLMLGVFLRGMRA
jgi:AcrR family transcriptional regulator